MSKRTLYMSSNGDTWSLFRDAGGVPVVLHEPNQSSGRNSTTLSVGEFLIRGNHGPQHKALLDMIGELVTYSGG